jgi:hypothetical protein
MYNGTQRTALWGGLGNISFDDISSRAAKDDTRVHATAEVWGYHSARNSSSALLEESTLRARILNAK